ncbi:MAG: putative thioredoxin, partial [Thermoleophilaceae bacterium]|nr:putative thioredoxin [Thermoleophilaceae bacterium]
GRLLLARGDADEAQKLLEPFASDFLAGGLAARARLTLDDAGLDDAFAAWDEGDHARALDELQGAFAAADSDTRDLVRRVMVAIFTELGAEHPLAREHRRKLSAVLY